ncbi:MAG TPA: hypothetical protein VNX01_06365 [Bacteroidia bacterium]|nr:hypothetical protein [Bacteroidia bacterium]
MKQFFLIHQRATLVIGLYFVSTAMTPAPPDLKSCGNNKPQHYFITLCRLYKVVQGLV